MRQDAAAKKPSCRIVYCFVGFHFFVDQNRSPADSVSIPLPLGQVDPPLLFPLRFFIEGFENFELRRRCRACEPSLAGCSDHTASAHTRVWRGSRAATECSIGLFAVCVRLLRACACAAMRTRKTTLCLRLHLERSTAPYQRLSRISSNARVSARSYRNAAVTR